jgi:site-specific DNA-cytosine methylase
VNILSLFDGMSCGQIALNRSGIKYDNYYASEIDKNSIFITQKNYPNTTQLGDITKLRYSDGILYSENNEFKVGKIDLIIGGSPCQSFSNSGKKEGFNGKSGLFYEYVRLLKEINPTYFLLENVKMKKEWKDKISEDLNVIPIEINSSLLSCQNRPRLYWTNIKNITIPEDKNIYLKDIVDFNIKGDDSCFTETFLKSDINFNSDKNQINENVKYQWQGVYTKKMKTINLGDGNRNYIYFPNIGVRKLTINEIEKCQTLPIDYTSGVSTTNRIKMIGNGWTVDVISHILKNIK